MKYLVIIPVRGGSKGIPVKNIKMLAGKPLINYTIEAAREVFNDEQICISTDDPEIIKVVEQIGITVPFVRPAYLATDEAGTYEVLLHALDFYEKKGHQIDIIILLQATSPFRKAEHIKEALQQFTNDLDMLVSVKESKLNPYFNLFEEDINGFLEKSKHSNATRRQDCPKVWEYNGAIYIINVDSLKEKPMNRFERIKKYEMDEISSHDIDTPFDWQIAESIASQGVTTRN